MIVAFSLLTLAIGFAWGRWGGNAYQDGFRDAHTICHGENRCTQMCQCKYIEERDGRWNK